MIDLDKDQALCNAATPGPWEILKEDVFGDGNISVLGVFATGDNENDVCIIETDYGVYPPREPDADFIANFDPPHIKEYIQALRERDKEIDELKQQVDTMHGAHLHCLSELDRLRDWHGRAVGKLGFMARVEELRLNGKPPDKRLLELRQLIEEAK